MTVNDLLELEDFNAVVLCEGEREISGVYIGDLLSWVMGKVQSSDAWITIMSNINILAVAALTDCACIILSEGVTLGEDVINTAKLKGVNVLAFAGSSYEAAIKLCKVI